MRITNFNILTSSRGFSILSLSFLLPILFFFCMLILASYQMISRYTGIQNECRNHVLHAQQVLGRNLKELMDLNPEARKLRVEEIHLKATIVSLAAIPPATVPFIRLLQVNQFRQALLRAKQEKIILSGLAQARSIMGDLGRKIKTAKQSSVKLMIYKFPPTAIAPDHLTVPAFKELQTIKVGWKYYIADFIPEVLLKIFSQVRYPKVIEGQCSATLIKKGDIWNPKLHLARF